MNQYLIYLTLTFSNPQVGEPKDIQASVILDDIYHQLREDDIELQGGCYSGHFSSIIFKLIRDAPIIDPVIEKLLIEDVANGEEKSK